MRVELKYTLQRLVCYNISCVNVILDLINRLQRCVRSVTCLQRYYYAIQAFIHVLKGVFYRAISCAGFNVNVYVKAYREVRIIRCNIAVYKDIASPQLLKGIAIIRAYVVQSLIIPYYYFRLKGLREVKPIAPITHIGRIQVNSPIGAIHYIIDNNAIEQQLTYRI